MTENQFVLATTVPNSAEDTGELIPIMEKFHENFGVHPKEQLADAGYASEANYKYLEKNKVESYIPHQKLKMNIDEYKYDKEKNTYEDKD